MSLICIDCGVDTTPCTGKRGCRHKGRHEYYMVRDRVWAEAGMRTGIVYHYGGGGDYLCIGCLEQRIGRKLHFADFTDVPVNHPGDPLAYAPASIATPARSRTGVSVGRRALGLA
jgi:hypothetical protein